MKRKIVFLLSIVLIVASCKKNEDLTVTLKQSGKLSVKITDGSNAVIPDVKVKLYDFSMFDKQFDNYIDVLKTNANGIVDFGEVNAGSYTVVVDTPKINGIKYMPYKGVQLVSGVAKELTINIQEYVGTLKLTIMDDDYYDPTPYSNINVILVPYESFNSYSTITSIISKAEFSGKTNSSGNISFTIPSDRRYYLLVYNDLKTSIDIYDDYIYMYKDQVMNLTFYAYFYI